MDDFIRPPKKEIKKEPKKRPVKEILIVLLIVVCLTIGYFAGYMSKKNVVVKNANNKGIINEVYDTLNKYWVNTTDQDINLDASAIEGMVLGLNDPHSSYLTSKEAVEFNQTVAGNYQGIGVGFSMVEQGAMITKVYEDSPASKAGLKVGDILTKADGKDLANIDSDKVKEYVRGDDGTEVNLTVLSNKKTSEVKVTRGALDTSAYYEIRKQGNVTFGYIELSTFGTDTAKQVEEALKAFKKANVETLVLDLRDNGGGYLTAATDILDLFFSSDEVIYQMKEKNSAAKKFYASTDNKYEFQNGYILVNGNTASASELTAGALQSEKGYQLIGTTTYGKGSAQTQKTLSDGSVLKYTYAKWMIPNGTCINGKGLTPDIEVENVSLDGISTKDIKETLKVDCVNSRVKSMQKMLNILGYPVDREDGYFSQTTQEALQKFETDNNLTVDGQYSQSDKQMLIARMMIYINNHENDKQYDYLMKIIK